MKTCVRPGCRETQLHKNVICSYVRRNARRGAAWTEIDSHRWIRVVVQKKKKKKLRITIESDVAYRDTSWLSFGESARVRVDDRNLSINR